MAGALLSIGKSGALAAREALELTGQNVANADNPAYTRRTLALAEMAGSAAGGRLTGSPGGVRVEGVSRRDAGFAQTEARRTGADLARAQAELGGLRQVETATEQAGIYPAMTAFEASLSRLSADPLDAAMRADTLEQARTATRSFNLAAQGLDAGLSATRDVLTAGVGELNRVAEELARTNTALARASLGSGAKAAMLDRRDALLSDLSRLGSLAADFDRAGRVAVRLGGAGGPLLVNEGSAASVSATEAPGGEVQFAVGGSALQLTGGSLAGHAQTLHATHGIRSELDAAAAQLVALANAAQASGVTPAGSGGSPLFAGTGAADIVVVLPDGGQLATAPAGSMAGSRSTANLDALRAALATDGPAAGIDRMQSRLSAAIAGRTTTRDVLNSLAGAAQTALQAQTAIDLDAEAVNLLRFQQAFQASGKVIQAAADIFDTMLGIR